MTNIPQRVRAKSGKNEKSNYFSLTEITRDFDLASAEVEVEMLDRPDVLPADMARGIVFRAFGSGQKPETRHSEKPG